MSTHTESTKRNGKAGPVKISSNRSRKKKRPQRPVREADAAEAQVAQEVQQEMQPLTEVIPPLAEAATAEPEKKERSRRRHGARKTAYTQWTSPVKKPFPPLGIAVFTTMRAMNSLVDVHDLASQPMISALDPNRASIYWWLRRLEGVGMAKKRGKKFILNRDAELPGGTPLPSVQDAPAAAHPTTMRNLVRAERKVTGKVVTVSAPDTVDVDIAVSNTGISVTVGGMRFNLRRA